MAVSKAQIKAVHKYTKENYYRPTINIRREYEQPIHDRAQELGLSTSAYIQALIKADLDNRIL